MSTEQSYAEYVCEQIADCGAVRYRKMFGEYMVYVNDKPIVLVCDNTAFVKIRDEISQLALKLEKGIPYEGTKEHYVLDIDNRNQCCEIVSVLEKITPIPKKRTRTKKKSE